MEVLDRAREISGEAVSRVIPAMTPAAVSYVGDMEDRFLELEQVPLVTTHVLHAGLYSRTVFIPKGVIITGALVKIDTVLTVYGSCLVWTGEDEPLKLDGYQVLPASGGRKQVFLAKEDTWLTMSFASQADSVEAAEKEFTDEWAMLQSRGGLNGRGGVADRVIITGDRICQER